MTVIPWLLGSPYAELDPELRKSLEVALHTGAALALLIASGRELLSELDGPRLVVLGLGSAPAALAGYLLEGRIESRLGTPKTIATGLLAGAVLLALADRAPERRRARDADARDGLWLGLAQACALAPGISRNGATRATARLRGFRRQDAAGLSRQLGLPVIAGATLLKAQRLRARPPAGARPARLAAGASASFAGALLTARRVRGDGTLLPYAAYRTALAAAILIRLKQGSRARPSRPSRL